MYRRSCCDNIQSSHPENCKCKTFQEQFAEVVGINNNGMNTEVVWEFGKSMNWTSSEIMKIVDIE